MTTNSGRRLSDWATTWKDGEDTPNTDRRDPTRTGPGAGRRWSDQAASKIGLAGAVISLGGTAYATNGTQTLTLNTNGNVYATPSWQVNSVAGSTATFTFTAFGTGTITSAAQSLAIVNASTLGGDSLALTLPSGCKVGSTAVGSVALLENSHTYTASGAVSSMADFTAAGGVATTLQFGGVTSSGAVTCSSAGSLAYTY